MATIVSWPPGFYACGVAAVLTRWRCRCGGRLSSERVNRLSWYGKTREEISRSILLKAAALFTPRTKTCPWGPRSDGRADLRALASAYRISGFAIAFSKGPLNAPFSLFAFPTAGGCRRAGASSDHRDLAHCGLHD